MSRLAALVGFGIDLSRQIPAITFCRHDTYITEALPHIYCKFMTSMPRKDYLPRVMKG